MYVPVEHAPVDVLQVPAAQSESRAQPHTDDVHLFDSQSEAAEHPVPAERFSAVHRELLHVPEQHCAFDEHEKPPTRQYVDTSLPTGR